MPSDLLMRVHSPGFQDMSERVMRAERCFQVEQVERAAVLNPASGAAVHCMGVLALSRLPARRAFSVSSGDTPAVVAAAWWLIDSMSRTLLGPVNGALVMPISSPW